MSHLRSLRRRRLSVWLAVAGLWAAASLLAVMVLYGVAPALAQAPVDLFRDACADGLGNPWIATTFAHKGTTADDDAAVIAFRDSGDNSGHLGLATARQVGATYGVAYDGRTNTLYVSAYHKRGTHFGPAGPGGIYAVDLPTGSVRTFAVVPNAGSDMHDPTNQYFPDRSGRFPAGKTSLGDLDIKPDGTELTAVNLNDRRIYRYSVPDGEALGSFAHGAVDEPWADEDARPWGLGYRGDRLYHGVVRTSQSAQNRDELEAEVFESAVDGSEMRRVATTGLNYDRGWVWFQDGLAIWNPWLDPPGNVTPDHGRYPMPILADIEFTADDQMVVGFRDRFGDQAFYTWPPQRPPTGEYIYNTPAGDVVPAWPEGDHWRFQVDPEFYSGDYGPAGNPRGHAEISFGGLAMIPGFDVLVMSANSPLEVSSAGAVWLSTTAGSDDRREQIYKFGEGDNFGKANGLGDIEVLCYTESETPTATPDTPTPQPTTPVPSQTPPASDTPVVTAPPSPTNTLAPTGTPVATGTPSSPPSETPPGPTPTGTPPTTTATAPATATSARRTPPAVEQPSPTPVLPRLPKTGGGPRNAEPWLVFLLEWLGIAVAYGVMRRSQRRRLRGD